MDMDTDTAMVAMDMDITDTAMARDLLRLSPDMDMATVTDTDTAMVAMDIMATTARGLLMLSPAMATTAMDTDMDTVMATTDKFLLLFSAVESSVQTKNLDHLV